MVRSTTVAAVLVVALSSCQGSAPAQQHSATPPGTPPEPGAPGLPPGATPTGQAPGSAPAATASASETTTAPAADEPVAVDQQCSRDDECTATIFPGCCACCGCVAPYAIRKDALERRQTKCHAIRCSLDRCAGRNCPNCKQQDESPAAACRQGRCQLGR